MDFSGFARERFTYGGRAFKLYTHSVENRPGILVLHEIFGVSNEVMRLARMIVEKRFTVWVPCLFGNPEKPFPRVNGLAGLAGMCIRREIRAFASNQSSPITKMLGGLCRSLSQRTGGGPIG